MRKTADIPNSLPEARSKMGEGLAELASFIAAAPCLAIAGILGRVIVSLARLAAEWRHVARSVAVWALQNLGWAALVELFHLLLG